MIGDDGDDDYRAAIIRQADDQDAALAAFLYDSIVDTHERTVWVTEGQIESV